MEIKLCVYCKNKIKDLNLIRNFAHLSVDMSIGNQADITRNIIIGD